MDPSLVLSEAVMAIKLGERGLARSLLNSLLAKDPDNEQALLWSAALAETPQEGIRILERILVVNPNNEQARNTLSMVRLNALANDSHRGVPPANGDGGMAQQAGSPGAYGQMDPNPIPVRAVVCSLCDWQDVGTPARCAKCGAVCDISNLRALSENFAANEQLMLAALQRWEQSERYARTFDGQINLARAYLNLNRSNDAIPHLRRAIEIRPDDHRVRRTLEHLRSRKLVLAVDDSMTIRRIVSIILERSGYRVAVACEGDEALLKVREELPDLILLDVVMPGMNGYQVCRQIRQDDRATKVPVVILSSSLLDRIKGRLSGVNDYLAKPFETDQLLYTIKRYV
jgi:CheY-like chemotaxis protein